MIWVVETYLGGDGPERDADAGVDVLGFGGEDGELSDGENIVSAAVTSSGFDSGVMDHKPLVYV